MERRKAYRIFLFNLLASAVIIFIFYSFYLLNRNIPERIYLIKGSAYDLNIGVPISVDVEDDSLEAAYYMNGGLPASAVKISSADNISNLNNIKITGNSTGKCSLKLKLFGLLSIGDIEVQVVEENMVYPGGQPIGIYLDTDGVMVIGTGEVKLQDGTAAEPAYNLVNSGDYILAVNGNAVNTKEELTEQILASNGEDVILTVRRNEEKINVRVTPAECEDGCYRAGIWVRDDTQGIGTLTFICMDGTFAALGHGISDVDTSQLIEVDNGALYDAYVYEIIKGANGKPGSLIGSIDYSENTFEGYISTNTNVGIFGFIEDMNSFGSGREPLNIGYSQEIEEGKATILCSVNGEVGEYEIEIEKIEHNSKGNKNMVICVTDEELLEMTGGIVQGMSGSPIIQNNKIVGAVTHVMVNDPTRGYGIFIETMLEHAKDISSE